MSTPLVVLVLVGTSAAHDPASAGVSAAMEQALSGQARVLSREVEELPTDDAALAMGRAAGADAIAEIAWSDARREHVKVHVHTGAATLWVDRRVEFATTDAPAERERTIGFTLASMLPARARSEPDTYVTSPAPPVASPPTEGSSPGDAALAGQTAPPAAQAPEHRRLGSVELALVGAIGKTGYANGVGAALAIERTLGGPWSARAEVGWRSGDAAAADARTLMLYLTPGIAWRPLLPDRERPFGLGVRGAYVIVREQLTRSIDGAAPPGQWQSGAKAVLEGAWQFADGALAVLALGGEATFGTLDVVVNGRTVASIDPLRLIGEAAVQARF